MHMHIRIPWSLAALVAAAGGLTVAAYGQNYNANGQNYNYGPPPGQAPGYDQQGAPRPTVWVLSEIHRVNQDEIRLSELALQRARSPEARDVAQRMLDDHRRLDDELMALAQQRGIQLIYPRPFNGMARRVADDARMATDQLQNAYGHRFDRMFAQSMFQGHEDVIQLLNDSLQRLDDPQIRHFVEHTIAVLKTHRHMAADLARHEGESVGGPGPS